MTGHPVRPGMAGGSVQVPGSRSITNRALVVAALAEGRSMLRRPLESVDLDTRESSTAAYERSDIAVVPAAGVIAEAMVSFVLAKAVLDKFGGDSLRETKRNLATYQEQVAAF